MDLNFVAQILQGNTSSRKRHKREIGGERRGREGGREERRAGEIQYSYRDCDEGGARMEREKREYLCVFYYWFQTHLNFYLSNQSSN